jgi:hypothetical protein
MPSVPKVNPFVGTWESSTISSFKDIYKIKEGEFSDFTSTIIFYENFTFTKNTNGKVTNGTYEFTKTKLKFFESTFNNGQTAAWTIRQPKEKLLDNVNYPELFSVDGGSRKVELDVYYVKVISEDVKLGKPK